ncbi:hypothetical protein F5X98DRAFT_383785 [Xylaria grammica]|nr:hypothetical protein F5X98DRAFT_383785 [Xylaria grammica]
MHFITLLLALVAAPAVNSYRIDPSLKDGAYFIPLLTNSTKFRASREIYGEPIPIGDVAPSTTVSERSVIGVVPVPATTHGCFHAIESRKDHDRAAEILSNWCDSGAKIPPLHTKYTDVVPGIMIARYASSIAFACSWAHKQGCAPNEIQDAWSQITNNCHGDLEGGEICAKHWKKCYGHSTVTSMICNDWI